MRADVRQWIGGGLVLLAILVLAPPLIGWRVKTITRSMSRPAEITNGPIFDELHLSPEQRQRIDALEKQYRTELVRSCENHCAMRMKIGTLLQSGNIDPRELENMSLQVGKAYSEAELATSREIARICEVLTPDQRKIYLRKIGAQISATCPTEFRSGK